MKFLRIAGDRVVNLSHVATVLFDEGAPDGHCRLVYRFLNGAADNEGWHGVFEDIPVAEERARLKEVAAVVDRPSAFFETESEICGLVNLGNVLYFELYEFGVRYWFAENDVLEDEAEMDDDPPGYFRRVLRAAAG